MAATNQDDTYDYIQKLIQGSGASLDYEEMHKALLENDASSNFGTASIGSKKSDPFDHSEDISDIPQENFVKSVAKMESPERTPTLASGIVDDKEMYQVEDLLVKLGSRLQNNGFSLSNNLKSVKSPGFGVSQAHDMLKLVDSLIDELDSSNLKLQQQLKASDQLEREIQSLKQQSREIEDYKAPQNNFSATNSKRIHELESGLEKVVQERDLLKLKLLSKPPPSPRKNVSTREQIEQDKRDYKDKTLRFQSWSREDLISSLQDVLDKFGIPNVSELPLALNEIVNVYKLLPQMQLVLLLIVCSRMQRYSFSI